MERRLHEKANGTSPSSIICINVRHLFPNRYKKKPVKWIGSSQRDIAALPDDAKREAGQQLFLVQSGLEPVDWKPMPSVGSGVNEIRVQAGGQWRVLYVAKFAGAVYVLHAFGKKTQRTAKSDIELASRRYNDLLLSLKSAK